MGSFSNIIYNLLHSIIDGDVFGKIPTFFKHWSANIAIETLARDCNAEPSIHQYASAVCNAQGIKDSTNNVNTKLFIQDNTFYYRSHSSWSIHYGE